MRFKEVYEWTVEYLKTLMSDEGADKYSLPAVIVNAIIAYEMDHMVCGCDLYE